GGEEVVLITVPSALVAVKIAHALVEERLAACVNIVPGLTSIYREEGSVVSDHELLLLVKTTTDAFPKLKERVKELHPYEVPEIVALPIAEGNREYLDWLRENTGLE
uniref:BG505 SOSIP-T33-31A n=1 Tax=Human immunodeficiency virus type 1 TaxID=11676 RepID=UPI001C611298|nr:Chain A, BG505 SOSIP-T33-31A [Human immunodeficiency virus 1]7L85_D Chain D, BG505 SOSIP-T33-31A [Human immunodeficiency virus 1]7L85_F Chain F, BG505 SOSIP-T33-31A [Human immunodeficiency virus 1]7L85_H Chain H, BG505 SOSIP-T33-31A [Human immunodeficiency virus 1]7L85_J Chain J, BG505 SOSIP-T33-31A [Human immunodeficiency virus 1]7L85_L Chain L, BG505 SOSIP-T33-31A [Human immunodeficiency virus 1]7L85_N Chain N, BG505 SOSIP-T33-31A [Human immunodeficiency virus 1]7L85_P Chain P, BG505 SO